MEDHNFLVLGHHFKRRDGVVRDNAVIARLEGLTRGRICQIVNLTLLAPEIQEGILSLREGNAHPAERDLRLLVSSPAWSNQREVWNLRLD